MRYLVLRGLTKDQCVINKSELISTVDPWSGFVESNQNMWTFDIQQVILCGGEWAKGEILEEDKWCGDSPLNH